MLELIVDYNGRLIFLHQEGFSGINWELSKNAFVFVL